MGNTTTKVQFAGREVLLVEGARTASGHQIYEVNGARCWANGVIGLMEKNGDPAPGPCTFVTFCPIGEVAEK